MSEVSESVGRYVGTIHLVTADADRRARTGELADALDVSAASVTEMLATLEDRGLATYEKYEGVTLTDEGEAAAREFLWRRCVAENFLEDDLDLDLSAFAAEGGGSADGANDTGGADGANATGGADTTVDGANATDEANADDPRAIGQALSEDAIHRLKELVDHPCDGQCNAPRDEYAACSENVREIREGDVREIAEDDAR